ncbi:MAG TPA: glucose 1-dehydrogenase [Anaeromyxobacter sp.]|nr:glucose 1-dehydrogenase [Anaeromyxobacter sp.]
MRAVAVFAAERQLRVVDHPEPQILSATQVALRIHEVGICGTDREIAAGAHGAPPEGERSLVIGHEALGEVVEVGTSVTRLKKGDLVVPTMRRPCRDMHCRACGHGWPEFCTTGEFLQRGIRGLHGFLAERVVDEQRYMVPVAAELRDVAVLTQPLSVAEAALRQVDDYQRRLPWAEELQGHGGRNPERVAVVIGAGPVGALAALALRVRGWETFIHSREPRGKKSALAEAFGIGWSSRREETMEELAKRVGPIDLVLEASGASPLAFEALPALGPNGVFVFTGIPGRKAPVPRELGNVMPGIVLRNQAVLGVTNPSVDAYRAAAQDLALFARRWPTLVPQLIGERRPMADAPAVLEGPARGFKEVLTVEA